MHMGKKKLVIQHFTLGSIVTIDFWFLLAGIPKWQQKAAAVREMYASCSTSADVGHQQRILQQLEERKRARAGGNERIRGLASSSAPSTTTAGVDPATFIIWNKLTVIADFDSVKRPKPNPSPSDSDSSSDSERKKEKKSKKIKVDDFRFVFLPLLIHRYFCCSEWKEEKTQKGNQSSFLQTI